MHVHNAQTPRAHIQSEQLAETQTTQIVAGHHSVSLECSVIVLWDEIQLVTHILCSIFIVHNSLTSEIVVLRIVVLVSSILSCRMLTSDNIDLINKLSTRAPIYSIVPNKLKDNKYMGETYTLLNCRKQIMAVAVSMISSYAGICVCVCAGVCKNWPMRVTVTTATTFIAALCPYRTNKCTFTVLRQVVCCEHNTHDLICIERFRKWTILYNNIHVTHTMALHE